MCGIVGVISIKGTKKYERLVKNALKSINHRGSDNSNVYQNENICFGYTRLAIRGLNQKCNQPLFVNNTVTFANGEVYKIKGVEIASNKSDIEPLVVKLLQDKEKIYDYIDADFSLCTYDLQNKKVFLARDFFGVKPLYYYWIDVDTLAFSSEIIGLKHLINESLEFNTESIVDYLVFGYPINNKTFYLNIKSFPPRTIFEWDLESNEKEFYTAKDNYIHYTKNKNNISEAFYNAVSSRLIADRKIGAHLSGGYDSTLIAYNAKNNLEYFTAYNKKNEKDLNISNLISDELKLNHYMIRLPDKYEYDDLITILSSPIMSTGAFVPYEIAKNASLYNIKVLLAGQGADELFLGYKRFNNIKNINSNKELVNILSNSDLQMLKRLFYGYDFEKKYSLLFKDEMFLLNAQQFYIDNFLVELLRIEDAVHMRFNIENRVPFLSLPIRCFINQYGITIDSENTKDSLYNAHQLFDSKALLVKDKSNMNRSLLEELKKVNLNEIFENRVFEDFNYALLNQYLKKIDLLSDKELFVIWTIYNINLWYKVNNFKSKIRV